MIPVSEWVSLWVPEIIFYVTLILTLVTVLISIFGRIKEDYRWLILNQSLFNLLELCFNQYTTNCMQDQRVLPLFVLKLLRECETCTYEGVSCEQCTIFN